MTEFVKGNLVRLITEAGNAEIVQVVEDQVDAVVQIAHMNDMDNDGNSYFSTHGNYVDANDYELVIGELATKVPKAIPTFEPSHSVDQIHEELEMLMVQMVQYYQASEVSGALHMRINASSYGSDNNVTVEYGAYIGHGDTVTTRRLDRSVKLAIDRAKEDKANKPVEITFQGEDAA
jgi:hypothetical protein|tara:strand:- start:318 stop:848 length:531 start_codon:yes stop_codon:yes gene_type:complete